MSSPDKPPPAPNPAAVIGQSQQANQATATRNLSMNAPNQVNPYGSMSTTYGPDGTPKYSWNFSPGEQDIYNQFTHNREGAADATGTAVNNVATTLATPFKLDNAATEGRLIDLGNRRLSPILAQQRAAKETQLYNQGAQPGTEAWDRAQTEIGRNETDAYDQLLLTGRKQAGDELLTERNQPFTELGSVFGLGTPQAPQWINQPQYNEQPVDVSGITQTGYQNSLLPWQNEQQYKQALMGGLFGLGGAAAGAGGRVLGGWANSPSGSSKINSWFGS